MYSLISVIVAGPDIASAHDPIHLHPEDANGNRLAAVRFGTTTIQTQPDEVSPLDLAALFDRWAQEIREQVGVLHPLVEADFTPSGGAA
jgi:dihydroorotase-like cyclic amidohydrolase